MYWQEIVNRILKVKEEDFDGFLHFQLSINSTDEKKRKELFGGADVATLADIIKHITDMPAPRKRTITLNFIVMEGIPVDVEYLMNLGLDADYFMVKLIPLNNTNQSVDNNLQTYANYKNYDRLVELGEKFKENGIPTCVDAIAKCEEAGLCCGQLAHIFV